MCGRARGVLRRLWRRAGQSRADRGPVHVLRRGRQDVDLPRDHVLWSVEQLGEVHESILIEHMFYHNGGGRLTWKCCDHGW